MNKRKHLIIYLLTILVFLTSCAIGDDSANFSLGRIGLEDSSPVMVGVDVTSTSNGWDYDTKLFKVENENTFAAVPFYDEAGLEIQTEIFPYSFVKINQDYSFSNLEIVYSYNDGYAYTEYEAFFIRHSDGSVFPYDHNNKPHPYTYISGYFTNTPYVQVDDAGYYYFINNLDYNLIKMDFSNPENPSTTAYSPSGDFVNNFKVTAEGHVIYSYSVDSTKYYRIKKANGQLYNIPISDKYMAYWIGLNGKIRYHDSGKIYTVTIDPSTYALTTTEQTVTLNNIDSSNDLLLTMSDRIIAIAPYGDDINEYENPTDTPRTITVTGISDITYAAASSDFYYLSGYNSSAEPILLKVASDDTATSVFPANTYDIDFLSVKQDDTIFFYGTAMSDGQKTIGKISPSGEISILDNSTVFQFDEFVLINR